jgi:hypothetical protein
MRNVQNQSLLIQVKGYVSYKAIILCESWTVYKEEFVNINFYVFSFFILII